LLLWPGRPTQVSRTEAVKNRSVTPDRGEALQGRSKYQQLFPLQPPNSCQISAGPAQKDALYAGSALYPARQNLWPMAAAALYPAVMSGQIFRHQHRVTYAECTLGNHVYYARYLNLLEEARGELFRSIGEPLGKWQEADAIFPVIECRIRYKGAARYDDLLLIELWLSELEGVRINFEYKILNEARKDIVLGSTLHVCTTVNEKPRRMPEELVEKLRAFLAVE
jgi:acyl-CoA thioester hydrolase